MIIYFGDPFIPLHQIKSVFINSASKRQIMNETEQCFHLQKYAVYYLLLFYIIFILMDVWLDAAKGSQLKLGYSTPRKLL